jgi:hypothetical protein
LRFLLCGRAQNPCLGRTHPHSLVAVGMTTFPAAHAGRTSRRSLTSGPALLKSMKVF